MNDLLLDTRLANQTYPTLCKITQSAMQQATGAAACSEGEILLLNQGGPETAHGGVTCDAGTDNSTSDDEHIYRSVRKRAKCLLALTWASGCLLLVRHAKAASGEPSRCEL